jgi:hypothetical protein
VQPLTAAEPGLSKRTFIGRPRDAAVKGTPMLTGAESETPSENFVRSLWKGERPLARTFWLYFFVGNNILTSIIAVLLSLSLFRDPSSSAINGGVIYLVVALLLSLIVCPAFSVFTAVAVIRSGSAYVKANSNSWPKILLGRLAQIISGVSGFGGPLCFVLGLCTIFFNH